MVQELNRAGVKAALSTLGANFARLKPSVGEPALISSVLKMCERLNYSNDNLDSAVTHITETHPKIDSNESISMLLKNALSGSNSGEAQQYNCTERDCYKGQLRLQLLWDGEPWETYTACPYCVPGRRLKSSYGKWATDDTHHERKKQAIVRAGLADYDRAKHNRIRQREGHKYE